MGQQQSIEGDIDYSNVNNWRFHPSKPNTFIPTFANNHHQQQNLNTNLTPLEEKPDVIYFHPTTFYFGKGSQQSIEKAKSDKKLDRCTQNVSSIFNETCNVYVPYYRQAKLGAYIKFEEGGQVLTEAYKDLKSAFLYYIRNIHKEGKGFYLAGHSQGAHHLINLLRDLFDKDNEESKFLRRHLIAAYAVGAEVGEDTYTHIPVSRNATSTGCWISWRTIDITVNHEHERWMKRAPEYIKVTNTPVNINPITWEVESYEKLVQSGVVPANEILSRVRSVIAQNAPNNRGTLFKNQLFPGVVGACGYDGYLRVDMEQKGVKDIKPWYAAFKNYHNIDYETFYQNIKENLPVRYRAWLSTYQNNNQSNINYNINNPNNQAAHSAPVQNNNNNNHVNYNQHPAIVQNNGANYNSNINYQSPPIVQNNGYNNVSYNNHQSPVQVNYNQHPAIVQNNIANYNSNINYQSPIIPNTVNYNNHQSPVQVNYNQYPAIAQNNNVNYNKNNVY